jgi:hypothetical protein
MEAELLDIKDHPRVRVHQSKDIRIARIAQTRRCCFFSPDFYLTTAALDAFIITREEKAI